MIYLCQNEKRVIMWLVNSSLFFLDESDRFPADSARLGGFVIENIEDFLALVFSCVTLPSPVGKVADGCTTIDCVNVVANYMGISYLWLDQVGQNCCSLAS